MSTECLHVSHDIIKYGNYGVESMTNHLSYKTKHIKSIDEFTFYRIYLELDNVVGVRIIDNEVVNVNLTPVEIELLAYILSQPLDYELTYKENKKMIKEVADILGRTAGSVIKSFGCLKEKQYLVKTNDGTFIPFAKLNDLRIKTKMSIEKNEHFCHDYLFRFCIK